MTEHHLSLRPIGENDYSVLREGRGIGRIRLSDERSGQERWSWSITVPLPVPSFGLGDAPSMEAAKAGAVLCAVDASRHRTLAPTLRRCARAGGMDGLVMTFVPDRPLSDADVAARRLVDFANATEAGQDGRIYIELINAQFLKAGGTPDQFRGAVDRAIAKGRLERHESGTYVKFTQAGAELFA
jgi:hypothetical protein